MLDKIEWRTVTEEAPLEAVIEGVTFRVVFVTGEAPASHPWRLREQTDQDEWADTGYVFPTSQAAQNYLEDFMREEGVLKP